MASKLSDEGGDEERFKLLRDVNPLGLGELII